MNDAAVASKQVDENFSPASRSRARAGIRASYREGTPRLMNWNKGGDSLDERLAAIDTRAILAAVGDLEDLRDHLADGDDDEPPEMRTDILNLHRLAMAAANGASDNAELFDLAIDLADRLDDMADIVDRLSRTVNAIATLAPDD